MLCCPLQGTCWFFLCACKDSYKDPNNALFIYLQMKPHKLADPVPGKIFILLHAMGPASAWLLAGIASGHGAHRTGSHPPADRNGLTVTPAPCPWLTCAFPTVVVLPPAPGGGDSSPLPALQTTARPASLFPRMTTGPSALLGAELLRVAAASWARARLTNPCFQNGGTVPVQCHPHRHKPGLKGELISVGKAPRAAVTQSPVAEITELYIAILGTAISAGRARTYHQLLGQSAVEQNFFKMAC